VRIPGINQTGVPGAEQISLGAISSAAQSQMRVSSALTKVVDDYQVMSNKAEAVAQYGQNYQSSLTVLDSAYDEMINQPHFDEKNNPTYRDISSRWSKSSMKHVNETLNNFTNSTARSEYQADITAYLRGKSNDMRGVARTRQVEFASGVLASQISSYAKQPNGSEKIQAAIEQQVSIGFMTPEEGVNRLQASLEDHASTQLTMSIQGAENDLELDAIRLSLLDNTNPYLSLASVKSAFTSLDQRESQMDKDLDDQQNGVYVDALTKVIMGDLTEAGDIDMLLVSDQITPKFHASLMKSLNTEMLGPEVDDWAEFSLIKRNMGDYNEAEILSNSMLTKDSRIKLLTDLSKWNDEEDKDLDWVGTQQSDEAYRLLKARFPLKGTPMQAMLGLSSVENSAAMTKLYNRISALPPGDKISSVIDVANQIIAEADAGIQTKTLVVPATIQEIIDQTDGASPERKKMLDAWQMKYNAKPAPADYIRAVQNDMMSLAKEMGVIV